METEILKFILSNHGSANTEELVYNLCDASSLSEIICKNDKFVSCLWNLEPRVVVRSTVRLCWGKDCPGCGRLHLCSGFLLSGFCQFSQLRRGCTFSHDLHSDYNQNILREFGLETLTRTELCLLLLQSNNSLLPSICHNYNNRSGCQDDCQRLHICERFLSRDCSCFRTHDFLAPQPFKLLQHKHIPDNLIKILKSVYANKEALRLADRTDHRGNRSSSSDHSDPLAASSSELTYEYKTNNSSQDPMSTGDTLNTGYDTDSSSDTSTNQNKSSGHVGRGGRGKRGHRGRGGGRGNRGNRQQDWTLSHSDLLDITNADLTKDYEVNENCQDPTTTEETLYDGYDSDSSSTVSTDQGKNARGGYGGNRGGRGKRGHMGHRGSRGGRGSRGNKQQEKTMSHNDPFAATNVDGPTNEYEPSNSRRGHVGNYRGNRGGRGGRGHRGSGANNPQADGTLSHSDFLAAANDDDTKGANSSQEDPSSGNGTNQNTSIRGGPGGGAQGNAGKTQNRGNDKPFQRTSPVSDVFAAGNTSDGNSNERQRRGQRDKTEICMFFIKGHCIHEDRCFKAHDKMPYRWELKQDGQWTPMADNEKIEKDYCDPENTYSTTNPPVHFDTMTCRKDEVRRLSTINSVLEPDYIHTTDWLWYWEDEYGKWYPYAAVTSEHRLASITSKELEEMYLKNNKDVVAFTAGSQSYELSFQDMIQTNIKYSTKRLVRRRPRFVSAAEVQTKRKRPANSTAVPDYWDKTQIPQIGYKRVTLQPSSGEYKEIRDLFCQTIFGFDILKIERIQNKTVWEAFQLQKTHMKSKNGGKPVTEKKLFHGTDPKFVDTICATNFDWRVCGVNGTVFGQGSYFARDAEYSHNYTGDYDPRFLFVSRVLVGEYTKGHPEYRRPPSKDGGDVNLYDSCVDNVMSPSIFVVFEKQQIYPEYLLQYRERGISNLYHNVFPQSTTTTRQTTYYQPAASSTTAPPSTSQNTSTNNQNSCVIA